MSRAEALVGGVIATAVVAIIASTVRADPPAPPTPPPSAEAIEAGRRAFGEVAQVLLSPRCRNCHPVGDRPLQGDEGRPHRMNISRRSVDAGLACSACHRARNAEAIGIAGGPPGAPGWNLPLRATPMVFEGRSPRALCEQLRDRGANGDRDLPALLAHVTDDALVRWAWSPGALRTRPPLSHAAFVAAFQTWVASGGACP
ncbi:MAG: hypothetical protein SFX73_13480 [Kofleriaceae bacterium]|nr:hypothetical protein [Kofleriaceae bacterium]